MSTQVANPFAPLGSVIAPGLALHVSCALVLLFLFVLQPFSTLVLVVGIALAWDRPPRWFAPLLVTMVAAYLGLVNVTKLPESDLAVYFQSFEDARQYDLTEFLLLYAREPLYYVSLYYFAHLPGVDTRIYVFLSTLVPYLVFLGAVLRICHQQGVPSRSSMALMLLLAFFPQLFSLSAHLMRQFLASALMMVYLANLACTGRRSWSVGLVAAMCHYSALLLLGLSFLRKLKNRSGLTSALWFGGAVLLAYAVAVLIAGYMVNIPVLGLVFVRISDNNQGIQLDPLGPAALAMAGMCVALAFHSLLRAREQAEWTIAFAVATISGLVLVASGQPNLTELSTRYFFYQYFLIGILLPFTLSRVAAVRGIVQVLAVLVVPLFFYKIENGDWQFAAVQDLLFAPAATLWSHLA